MKLDYFLPRGLVLTAATVLLVGSAQGSTPPDPFSYSRTTEYTYDPTSGRLDTSTVEPSEPLLCTNEKRSYDAYGNVNQIELSSCSATKLTRADFATRQSLTTYGAQAPQAVVVNGSAVSLAAAAGIFQTQAANAIGQSTLALQDPRYGLATQVTAPNGAVVRTSYDDFGRIVNQVAADGTSIAHFHCLLPVAGAAFLATNTSGCPEGSGQAPAGAVRFVHSEPRSTSGSKMGPFTRVYFDGAGRELRQLTESFDSATQPATHRAALIAQDKVYSEAGLVVLSTAPYFLSTGSSTTTGANDVTVTLAQYDALGRVIAIKESRPGAAASVSFGAGGTFGYGSYGTRTAIVTATQYSSLKVTTTDTDGRVTVSERNALGQVVRSTDALGAQVAHLHDAFGNRVQTKDALQNSIFAQFDLRGHRVRLTDPDHGLVKTCVDALGQVKAEQSSQMRGSHSEPACPSTRDVGLQATSVAAWITTAYDQLGRLAQVTSPSVVKTYAYDAGVGAVGKLTQVKLSTGLTRSFYYDAIGRRLSARTDVANGPSWAESRSYDGITGRISGITYPTGLRLLPGYTALGFESSSTTATALTINPLPAVPGGAPAPSATWAAGTVLASVVRVDAANRTESSAFANGLNSQRVRDASGRPVELSVGTTSSPGSVVRLTYGWAPNGNLLSRVDNLGDGSGAAVSETFTHDELNRLAQYKVAGPGVGGLQRTVQMGYNALGMLQSKSEVGAYTYGTQGVGLDQPHAPKAIGGTSLAYDLNGNLISASSGKYRSLSFNEFDRVTQVQGTAGLAYTWVYDENNERIKELRTSGATSRTTWYAGLLEREVNSLTDDSLNRNRHTLQVGSVVFGTFISAGALPSLAAGATAPTSLSSMAGVRLEFQHRDMLQSVVATSDHTGAVTARMAHDPFGSRRFTNGSSDPSGTLVVDWSANTSGGTGIGFTGHEELDDIGLINANARLYDDRAGVFIQADPLIQAPDNTQNYARYAYVFNNPLVMTDPSGMAADACGPYYDQEPHAKRVRTTCGHYLRKMEVADKEAEEKAKSNTNSQTVGNVESVEGKAARQAMRGGAVSESADAAKKVGEVAGQGFRIAKNFVDGGFGEKTGAALVDGQYAWAATYTVAGTAYSVANVLMLGEAGGISKFLTDSLTKLESLFVVNGIPPLRAAYVEAVSELRPMADSLRAAGADTEALARALHAERRAIGEQFKALTPANKLAEIYERNLQKYGDKLGPTIDWLRARGKSWDQIIESATRTGGKDLGF